MFFGPVFGFCSVSSGGRRMGGAVLQELERKIEAVRPRPRGARGAVAPTGIPGLDALLPGGGLPRGLPIEWLGPPSCGKTAVLRTALDRLLAAGEAVALVDTTRTLYAPDWTEAAGRGRLWVVRPEGSVQAARCADLLLRSGVFGAVVLEVGDVPTGGWGRWPEGERTPGSGALSGRVTVRLQRLAEEAGVVFVVVGRTPLAGLRLGFRPARLEVPGGTPFGPSLPPVRPVWVRVGGRGEREQPVLCPAPPFRGGEAAARDRKGPR